MIVDMQGNPAKIKPNWVIRFEFDAEEYDKENIRNIANQISIMLNNSDLKHQGTFGTTDDEVCGNL